MSRHNVWQGWLEVEHHLSAWLGKLRPMGRMHPANGFHAACQGLVIHSRYLEREYIRLGVLGPLYTSFYRHIELNSW